MLKIFLRTVCLYMLVLLGCSKTENNPLISQNKSVIRGTIYVDGVPSNDYQVIARKVYGTALSGKVAAKVANNEMVSEIANGKYSVEVAPGDYELEISSIKYGYNKENSTYRYVTVKSNTDCYYDIQLKSSCSSLNVKSSGLYIEANINIDLHNVNLYELYIKKPNSDWTRRKILGLTWYDTLSEVGVYSAKIRKLNNFGLWTDSSVVSVNVDPIPVVVGCDIFDSTNFYLVGIKGFFDKKKYSLIIFRSIATKPYLPIDTVEYTENGLLSYYDSNYIYIYQDLLQNSDSLTYKFRLKDVKTGSLGEFSAPFSPKKNNINFNSKIIDKIEYLMYEFNSDPIKQFKSTYQGRWVFLKKMALDSNYTPLDTVYEEPSQDYYNESMVKTSRRVIGLYYYKIVNYYDNNLVLITDKLVNTTNEYVYTPSYLSLFIGVKGIEIKTSIMNYPLMGDLMRCTPVFVWRDDLNNGSSILIDSTCLGGSIYDPLSPEQKGKRFTYHASSRLPDGKMSKVVYPKEEVYIPSKMNFSPNITITKLSDGRVDIEHIYIYNVRNNYFGIYSDFNSPILVIERENSPFSNTQLKIYDTIGYDYRHLLNDTVSENGNYTYKAWYEYAALDLRSDTVIIPININGKLSSPKVIFDKTNSSFPILKFTLANKITDPIAILRSYSGRSDTIVRQINYNELSIYDTIRNNMVDSIEYKFALKSKGAFGDFSNTIMYNVTSKLEVPFLTTKSSVDTAARIKVVFTSYADSARVYRSSSSGGNYTLIMTKANQRYSDSLVIFDTAISEQSTYYYKVQSVCGDLISELSAEKAVHIGTKPLSPVLLSFSTNINDYESPYYVYTILKWKAVAGATSYEIYRDGLFYKILPNTVLTFTDEGVSFKNLNEQDFLFPNTFRYKVRAKADDRQGIFSPEYEVSYNAFSFDFLSVRIIK